MKNKFIVVAHVNNQISVLNRITSIYLKKGLNIESLLLQESDANGISVVTIKSLDTPEGMERVVNLLENMIDVHHADFYKC